jgi:TrmH family RNA methyltransferase
MILSVGIIKLFNSLKLKKYRDKSGLFCAEGEKIIIDLFESGLALKYLVLEDGKFRPEYKQVKEKVIYTDKKGLKKISNLKTVPQAVAIFEMPQYSFDYKSIEDQLILYCDDIRDPGNLGTIIRTSDWFGIKQIVCSPGTVDVFNSKVIQATMGSVGRVNVHYIHSVEFFNAIQINIPIYGTYLEGEDIYDCELTRNGIVIIGNEGTGITKETGKFVNRIIRIPDFSDSMTKPESLNASVAAAIVCSEFRRRR